MGCRGGGWECLPCTVPWGRETLVLVGGGREKGRRRAGDGGRVTGALAGRRKDSGLTRRVLGSSSAVFTWIKI